MKFITSISLADWFLYGQETLYNLDKNLPMNAAFIIYADDPLPLPKPFSQRVSVRPYVQPASILTEMAARLPVFSGRIGGNYDYRHNYRAFSRKVMAILETLMAGETEMLFWIDADTRFVTPPPATVFESFLAEHPICVMQRNQWHLCSSFVGFNLKVPAVMDFLEHFCLLYSSGLVLTLPHWDDAGVLHTLLSENRDTIHVKDLSPPNLPEGPVNIFDIVFAQYGGNHLKGNIKTTATPSLHQPKRYKVITDTAAELGLEGVGKVFVEIGTWKGDRAVDIAKACGTNFKYIGFDVFEMYPAALDAIEMNAKPHIPIATVRDRLKAANIDAELIQGSTQDTLPLYTSKHQNFADLVYIDGGHSMQTIVHDLEYAMRMVKDTGIIIMDDYYEECDEDTMSRFGAQTVLGLPGAPPYTLSPPEGDWKREGGKIRLAVIQGKHCKHGT